MSTSAYKGKLVTISLQNSGSPTTYTVIAAGKTTSLKFSVSAPDITNYGSGGFTELLVPAGTQKAALDFSGVYVHDTEQKALIVAATTLTPVNLKFTDGAGNTLTGAFLVSALSMTGATAAEQGFTATFDSTGAYTWTAGS